MSDPRRSAITRILRTTTQLSAKTTFYAAALSRIYLIASNTSPESLPPTLATVAGGLGVEALGGLIERLSRGESVREDEIGQQVLQAIESSKIVDVLTQNDLRRDLSEMIRKTNLNRIYETMLENHVEFKLLFGEQAAKLDMLLERLSDFPDQIFNIRDINGEYVNGRHTKNHYH